MDAVKILIPFYSRNGSTETLAKAVAEGAKSEGAEVRLRRARDIVAEEIIRSVPAWAENRDRMYAASEAPPRLMQNGRMVLFSARPLDLGMYVRNLRPTSIHWADFGFRGS
jgi:hypothetical protein